MIDLIKEFFERHPQGGPEDQAREESHDVRVATGALFLEMANIDGTYSKSEQQSIMTILKKEYHLSDECVDALLEASDEQLKGSIDYWQFTNLINKNYSTAEKLRIIEMVWKIAYTDGTLDKHEDYFVHKLAKLLHLTHKQLIDAKLKIIYGDDT